MTYRYPRYRYYGYRYRRGLTGKQAAGAVAVAVVLAGVTAATGHHHHSGKPSPQDVAAPVISGTGLNTRAGWARAFLRAIPEPRTACNLSAVVAWETREGGGFGNQAAFNALNVNPGPGAPWPGYNAIGAWAFPDAQTGLDYTVRTIENGNYGGILAALHAGNSAQAVCDAIMNSPWAESHYGGTLTAEC